MDQNLFSPRNHFNYKILPLTEENHKLKEELQQLFKHYEEQRQTLASLIMDSDKHGESRQVFKKISGFETLLILLSEDLNDYRTQIDNLQQKLISLEIKHTLLLEEKQEKFVKLDVEFQIKHEQLEEQAEELASKEIINQKNLQLVQQTMQEKFEEHKLESIGYCLEIDQLKKYNNEKSDEINHWVDLYNELKNNLTNYENSIKEAHEMQFEASTIQLKQETEQYIKSIDLNLHQVKEDYENRIMIFEIEKYQVTQKLEKTQTEKQKIQEENYNFRRIIQTLNSEIAHHQNSIKILQDGLKEHHSHEGNYKSIIEQYKNQQLAQEKVIDELTTLCKKQEGEIISNSKQFEDQLQQEKDDHLESIQSLEREWVMKFQLFEEQMRKKLKIIHDEQTAKIEEIKQTTESQFVDKYGVSVKQILHSKKDPYLDDELSYLELKKLTQLLRQQIEAEQTEYRELKKIMDTQVQEMSNHNKDLTSKLLNQRDLEQEVEKRLEGAYKDKFMKMGEDCHEQIKEQQRLANHAVEMIRKNCKEEVQKFEEQLKTTEKQRKILIVEKNRLQQYVDQVVVERDHYFEQVNGIKKELESLTEENETFKSELTQLNIKLETRDKDLNDLQNQLHSQKKKIQQLKKTHEEKAMQNKKEFEEQIEALVVQKSEVEKQYKHYSQYRDKYKQAQEKLDEQSNQLAELEIKLQHALRIVEYFQQEMENYKDVYNIFKQKPDDGMIRDRDVLIDKMKQTKRKIDQSLVECNRFRKGKQLSKLYQTESVEQERKIIPLPKKISGVQQTKQQAYYPVIYQKTILDKQSSLREISPQEFSDTSLINHANIYNSFDNNQIKAVLNKSFEDNQSSGHLPFFIKKQKSKLIQGKKSLFFPNFSTTNPSKKTIWRIFHN